MSSSPNGQFLLLDDNRDALATRLHLLRQAQHSIKLQTYIWEEDKSGHLLARELIAAADRGVKVQLLLDDFNTSNELRLFRALDAHPYIAIKLFNPIPKSWRQGIFRWLKLIWEVRRLNRRMHNKALIIDHGLTIVGGRNIGDEYFGLSEKYNFIDLDIICDGEIVEDIQSSFNQYWRHPYAKPIKRWYRAKRRKHFRKRLEKIRHFDIKQQALGEIFYYYDDQRWQEKLSQLVTAKASVVIDSPDYFSLQQLIPPNKEVAQQLAKLLASPMQSLTIESAYLVLTEQEISQLQTLKASGADIKLLTNSLATNDVLANHAGYRNTRSALLKKGVFPHELTLNKTAPMSLHSKSVVIDHRLLFLGSYNLNIRSALLNSELALVIDHPELAQQVEKRVHQLMAEAWQAQLSKRHKIYWSQQTTEKQVHKEPDSRWYQRLTSYLLSKLSISRYF